MATFWTSCKNKNWASNIVRKIKKGTDAEAESFVKQNYEFFGKQKRILKGRKVDSIATTNYYRVTDIDKMFENSGAMRSLDVNTLFELIFNGTKYIRIR